jgi:hypothetical protein
MKQSSKEKNVRQIENTKLNDKFYYFYERGKITLYNLCNQQVFQQC